jgi:8-oxo-dGTP pyrophosphatase MutT (NUDIX family)
MVTDHAALGRTAADAVTQEVEEEAGIRLSAPPRLIADVFMSPGSLTERVALFVGTYSAADRIGPGGGLAHEGEDIMLLEPRLDDALEMVARGEIADAKTVILLYWAALNRKSLAGLSGGQA